MRQSPDRRSSKASARHDAVDRRAQDGRQEQELTWRFSAHADRRYAKIAMSLALASFCLVVTFDNITDYGTNYLFLRHVMSMDTTFPGNALMYRSVTNPALWQLG